MKTGQEDRDRYGCATGWSREGGRLPVLTAVLGSKVRA